MVAESFESKKARIRAASPYGHLANWNVMSVIVKTGADLRQEQFAIQLVREFDLIWSEETCPHWVRLCVSPRCTEFHLSDLTLLQLSNHGHERKYWHD